jgi:hypothetical protein
MQFPATLLVTGVLAAGLGLPRSAEHPPVWRLRPRSRP